MKKFDLIFTLVLSVVIGVFIFFLTSLWSWHLPQNEKEISVLWVWLEISIVISKICYLTGHFVISRLKSVNQWFIWLSQFLIWFISFNAAYFFVGIIFNAVHFLLNQNDKISLQNFFQHLISPIPNEVGPPSPFDLIIINAIVLVITAFVFIICLTINRYSLADI